MPPTRAHNARGRDTALDFARGRILQAPGKETQTTHLFDSRRLDPLGRERLIPLENARTTQFEQAREASAWQPESSESFLLALSGKRRSSRRSSIDFKDLRTVPEISSRRGLR